MSGFHTPGHHTPLGLGVLFSTTHGRTGSIPRPLFVLCRSSALDTVSLLDCASDPLLFLSAPPGVTHRQGQSRPVSPPLAPSGFGGHPWAPSPHRGARASPKRWWGAVSRDGQVGPHEDSWWPKFPAGDDTSVDRAWLLRLENMRPRLSWPGAQHSGPSLEVSSLATAMWSLGAQTRSFQRQAEPWSSRGVPDCCCCPGRRAAQECKSCRLKAGLGPVWIGGVRRAWESWWAGASLARTSGSYLAWGAVTRMGQAALRPLGVGQRRAGQSWSWLGWGRNGMGAGAWPGLGAASLHQPCPRCCPASPQPGWEKQPGAAG